MDEHDKLPVPRPARTDDPAPLPMQEILSSLPGAEIRPLGPSDERIMSFMGVDGVARGLMESGWDAAEEVKELVSLARYAEKDSDRISAMRQVRRVVRESAELRGLLVTQQVDARARGMHGTARLSSRQTRLLSTLQDSSHAALHSGFSACTDHHAAVSSAAALPPARSASEDFARKRHLDPTLVERTITDLNTATRDDGSRDGGGSGVPPDGTSQPRATTSDGVRSRNDLDRGIA